MTYKEIHAMMDGARELLNNPLWSWACKTTEDLVGYFIHEWFWTVDDMPENNQCIRVAENTAAKMFNKR